MRALPILLLLGCPLGAGPDAVPDKDDTGDAPAPVDLVLLVDNSTSMEEETAEIALAAEDIVATLAASGDWQIGVTSVTTDATYGDRGVAGRLFADPVRLSDAGAAEALREVIVCEATCWNETELDSDPAYVCGEVPAKVSAEYLDCVCGEGGWQDHCGGGNEQGLEAALLAACRAVDTPTDACYGYVGEGSSTEIPSAIDAGAAGSNAGLLRGGPVHFLVITDEGDSSPRMPAGDADVAPYGNAIEGLGLDWRFSVLGPAWDGETGDCLAGAQPWAVERYQAIAEGSGGVYVEIADLDAGCDTTDPTAVFDALAAL
jgi:hypothetical protein